MQEYLSNLDPDYDVYEQPVFLYMNFDWLELWLGLLVVMQIVYA